jgi:hypothetical protein
MISELWHIASGNLLEDFETESEALEAVRSYVEVNGLGMIDELSLSAAPTLMSETSGSLPPSLRGEALAKRAGVVLTAHQPSGDNGVDAAGPPQASDGVGQSSIGALSARQRHSH